MRIRVRIEDLPTGSLFQYEDTIGFKSEYSNDDGQCKCYILGTGEMFWGSSTLKVNDHLVKLIDLEYLIKQQEILSRIANTWIGIENNGTSEDAGNFYTIVQDILTDR